MEVFLANLAAGATTLAPEAATMAANVVGTTAAETAAAGAAADAAADAYAAGVTTTGLGAIPKAVTAAAPEAVTADAPEATGIMQATNGTENLMQTGANGVNSGATAINDITGQPYDITQGVSQSGQINTQDLINAQNGAPSQGITTQALDKGIYDPFREGAQTATDMFSNIGNKFGQVMDSV